MMKNRVTDKTDDNYISEFVVEQCKSTKKRRNKKMKIGRYS